MEKKEEPKPLEETTEEVPVVRPPDGGWGWAVVLGSFLCNVIVDGIIFSYGLLLPELANDLGESKGRLAWVGSLLAGFYLIAGPLVSGLANTYGCRPVTIVGTIISSVSFALASLSPTMEYLCLSFGFLGGVGFGFIYLPAVVTVGFYFEKKRAFATGLAVCGSGVGTFLMAPFVQYLLVHYSWRGTVLILSGVILNCACFGALFRPLKAPERRQTEDESNSAKPPLLQRIKMYRDSERQRWDSVEIIPAVSQVSVSMPEIPCVVEDTSSESPTTSNENSPPPSYSDVVGADDDELLTFLMVPPWLQPSKFIPPKSEESEKPKKLRYGVRPDVNRPFYRQDILYSASLLNLPEFKKSQQDLELYAASVTKIPVDETSGRGCLSPAMRETFRQMLDLSLLRSPTFILLSVGGFLTLAGLFVPFMFVVDRAVQQGISMDSATYILPVIGITNTLGRVICGYISDKPWLNALTINNGALVIGGLATALSTYFTSIELLLVYGGIFGASIGCFATLRSIIIVELLGLDKLTNAFGLLLLFQGIASMIGAPVSGMFYDATGNYDAPFFISGSLILLSGLLGIPLPYLAKWEKNRRASVTSHIMITIDSPEVTNVAEAVQV